MRAFTWMCVALMTTMIGAAPASAQTPSQAAAEAGGCTTSGSASLGTYFRTCTSSSGTLTEITGQSGVSNLKSEGYSLCAGSMQSVDNGSSSPGFNPPTTSTQTSNVRTTSDGRLKLTQTFTRDAAEKEIIITMTVRNQTTSPVTGVALARFFDGDMGGSRFGDSYVAMRTSVVAHQGYIYDGLSLSARTLNFPVQTDIEEYDEHSPFFSGCFANTPIFPTTPSPFGDWVGWVTYELGTINAGASKIVKFVYRVL